MSFLKSLRSEVLKSRRTSTSYVYCTLLFFIPCILCVEYSIHENVDDKIGTNPWSILVADGFMLFNLVVLPLFTLLITTINPQLEYRNKTWKQVLTSPQSFVDIWFSRYLKVLLMIALFTILHAVLLIFTGFMVGLIFPQYTMLEHAVDISLLINSTIKSVVCVLGISAAQYWLGMRSKNFIVPLVFGFLIWMISSTTTFDLNMSENLNPFTYLMYASFAKKGSSMIWVTIYSTLWCVVLLMLGLFDFKVRRPQFG